MSDESADTVCGYDTARSGPCQNPATEGDHCWIPSHGDEHAENPHGAPEENTNAQGNEGGSPPPENTNAVTHGLYVETDRYYEIQDEADQRLIREMFESWVRKSTLDPEVDIGDCTKLWQAAVDLHKRQSINADIADDGVSEETIIGTDESGRPIAKIEEHHLHLTYDRIGRETTQVLNKYGILDSPEKQQASATKSLAQLLSGSGD